MTTVRPTFTHSTAKMKRWWESTAWMCYTGPLPARAQSLVAEWASLRQAELQAAWERAKSLEQPGKIAPLD